MSTDLERAVRAYAGYLDETLPTITSDDIRATATEQLGTRQPQVVWYRRPAIVFAATLIAVLLIALVPVVLLSSGRGDVSNQPRPEPEPHPPQAAVEVDASGDSLWAWEYEGNRVWRYADGEWQELPPTPGEVLRVVSDGETTWAITGDFDVRYLDGATWRDLDVPAMILRLAADASSGTLWMSTGERLYRWDGESLTEVDRPAIAVVDDEFPVRTYVGDVAVTGDGTLWAGGLYGYLPALGVFATYDHDTETWEAVQPWNDKPVPAAALAPTTTGGLWALLEEWDGNRWALAYRDGDTERWNVYDDNLPDIHPFAIAADGDGVWIAQGNALVEGVEPMSGVYHFDGHTWNHYLIGVDVSDVAVALDGTVWYMADR